MKRILILLYLIISLGSISSQNLTSAFFVYHNNTAPILFFYEDIDSIRQSHIDLDSIEHPEFVVTEFWTADSVHRIPIASIDSISFTTPSEIRKPNSVEITNQQLQYLVNVDSLTLKFLPSTPQQILPKIGEKLTYLNTTNLLPNGFIGQVNSIIKKDDGIFIYCDSIDVSDAFSRLFIIGEYISSTNISEKKIPRGFSTGLKYFELKPIEIALNIPKSFPIDNHFSEISIPTGDFDFGFQNEIDLKLAYAPSGRYAFTFNEYDSSYQNYYIKFYGPLTYTIYSELNAKISLDLYKIIKEGLLGIKVPLPTPPLPVCEVVMYPELSLSGSIGLNMRYDHSIDIGYETNFSTDPNFKNFADIIGPDIHSPQLNVDFASASIELFGGAFLGLRINIPSGFIDAGVSFGSSSNYNFRFGLRDIDLAQLKTDIYDKFFVDATYTTKLVLEPKIRGTFFNYFSFCKGKTFSFKENERKILPKFTKPSYKEFKSQTILEYEVVDDIFLPIIPGIKVVDENNNLIFQDYSDISIQNGNTIVDFPYIHKTFNKKCRAYPIFKLFGYEFMASSSLLLELQVKPITDKAHSNSDNATLFGYLETDSKTPLNLTASECTVGFCYSTSPTNVHEGTIIESNLNSDYSFASTISDLSINSTYYYCAFIYINGETIYGKIKEFQTKEDEEVDLGLSVNWRGWNIGAQHSYEDGDYYAWGERTTKNEFSWNTYFDNPYTESNQWKGCSLNSDISASLDYDPSKYLPNDSWRMPTREEMQELLDKCNWVWTEVNSVNGYNITGPNGNSIFLPANGLADGTEINNKGSYGSYWTSTPQIATEGKATASTLYFYGSSLKSQQWANRYGGRAVRPVKDKQ